MPQGFTRNGNDYLWLIVLEHFSYEWILTKVMCIGVFVILKVVKEICIWYETSHGFELLNYGKVM
jgi:hypothetical protein